MNRVLLSSGVDYYFIIGGSLSVDHLLSAPLFEVPAIVFIFRATPSAPALLVAFTVASSYPHFWCLLFVQRRFLWQKNFYALLPCLGL